MKNGNTIDYNQNRIVVTKANGEAQEFSEKKLRRSIQRAKIPKKLENKVVSHIKSKLYSGIPTSEIFQDILSSIRESDHPYTGARYSLKQSIMDLGPSGYPFEKYIAAVLKKYQYYTQTNLILKGKCVEHEVDVLAEKYGKRAFVECKFHNQSGSRSDIKVALYTYATLLDLTEGYRQFGDQMEIHEAWIVTNTKATSEAIKYANCVGMRIIGWNYPRAGNLQEMIEEKRLQPITCLSTLNGQQKKLLLSLGIVLCSDLIKSGEGPLKEIGIEKEQKKLIQEEANEVCAASLDTN